MSQADLLKARTKAFAVNVVLFCRTLPHSLETYKIAGQLIEAATSVGANYRACCRARSPAEFISKIGVVLEEADESEFWLDLLVELGHCPEKAKVLRQEAGELTAVFAASSITAR